MNKNRKLNVRIRALILMFPDRDAIWAELLIYEIKLTQLFTVLV